MKTATGCQEILEHHYTCLVGGRIVVQNVYAAGGTGLDQFVFISYLGQPEFVPNKKVQSSVTRPSLEIEMNLHEGAADV